MARPSNSIANIKLPGESTKRPIVPYAVGVSQSNSYQAILPELTADDYIAISKLFALQYDPTRTSMALRYTKGEYCIYQGYLYKAKATTYGAWDSTKWEKVNITDELNILQYGRYTHSTYGYTKNALSFIIEGTSLNILDSSDHTEGMMSFVSREATGSSYVNYSTIIYPGRITLDGVDVATVIQVPSSFAWTNGTTAGPTGDLKNSSGTTLATFPAIPSASVNVSGIVTIDDQNFAGNKTIYGNVIISGNDRGFKIKNIQSTVDEQTEYLRSKITRTRDAQGTSGDYSYEYLYPDRSGTLGLQIDIVDLTELAA